MRRFYALVENFDEKEVLLDPEQSGHLRNVLRLSAGDRVQVFDGRGNEFLCRIERIEKRQAALKILAEVSPPASESNLELTLAVALLKGEKFELVIQKAVELGVKRLLPVSTRRCDIKLKNPAVKLARWEKIIIEASKQTGRARLMELGEPTDFEAFLKDSEAQNPGGGKLLFAERGGGNFGVIEPAEKIIAVSGPEGGWEDAEIARAADHGFQIITLGGRILRAETAALTIAALVQHNFGDLF